MDIIFKSVFVLVGIVEIVVVVILCRQVWDQRGDRTSRPLIIGGADLLWCAAAFGGPMVLTGLVAHGWRDSIELDAIGYGFVFGIVCAALMTYARRKTTIRDETVWLALLVPMGFGVLAGLAGV